MVSYDLENIQLCFGLAWVAHSEDSCVFRNVKSHTFNFVKIRINIIVSYQRFKIITRTKAMK